METLCLVRPIRLRQFAGRLHPRGIADLAVADDLTVSNPLVGWPPSARFQGIVPRFRRAYLDQEPGRLALAEREGLTRVITRLRCGACGGARLNPTMLSCKINGNSISDCACLEVSDLLALIRTISVKSV